MLARQPPIVGAVTHREMCLGGDDHLVALRHIFDGTPQNFFTHPERVHVGGIEEIDAVFERSPEEPTALRLGQHPVAPARRPVGHHAETEPGHLQAGSPE